jgi:hypothetical protein
MFPHNHIDTQIEPLCSSCKRVDGRQVRLQRFYLSCIAISTPTTLTLFLSPSRHTNTSTHTFSPRIHSPFPHPPSPPPIITHTVSERMQMNFGSFLRKSENALIRRKRDFLYTTRTSYNCTSGRGVSEYLEWPEV